MEELTYDDLLEIAEDCDACPLHARRRNVVFGSGDLDAKVVFVGEAPGREEEATGEPFVGAAGDILDRALDAAGINRDDVYITNIVKCRPPSNRDPKPEEINSCIYFLNEQLRIIRPRLIVTLGRFAANLLVGKGAMRTLHGSTLKKRMSWGETMCYCVYHPAAALYSPGMYPRIQSAIMRIPMLVVPGPEMMFQVFE